MTETTKDVNAQLTSRRLSARNTVWNPVGQALPVGVGLVIVPLISTMAGLADSIETEKTCAL
jgi:hypothetical protein